MKARAVVVKGRVIPVDPKDIIKIDLTGGTNSKGYSYVIVELGSLTPEELASVESRL